MAIQITSRAFGEGASIPKQYTGEGADRSPPLAWQGIPDGTRQLALICDDPDAPTPEPWVHWVLYNIPPDTRELPEGVAGTLHLNEPPGAIQGKNSWPSGRTIGYRGPMPPPGHGVHRYFFKLYALDVELDLKPGAAKSELVEATKGHVLDQGTLIGTYAR
jgi:Raf kinase inhibitor-like YbhB/YbcL family protein